MKQFVYLICIALCFSCAKKEVQLPQTTNQDIIDIYDVSPIYMFYDEENDSIEFNRKNMISTTNWLVNIDKRLTLKQILPHLQYLQNKRHGDGMHKNENARNYFTCHNTEIENLSFIEFTETSYKFSIQKTISDALKNSFTKNKYTKQNFKNTNFYKSLDIGYDLEILFDSNEKIYLNNEKINLDYLLAYINDNIENNTLTDYIEISLSFNQNITFQDYITFKSFLLEQDNKKIVLSNEEIIYK